MGTLLTLIIGCVFAILGVVGAYLKGKTDKTKDEAQSRADTFRRVQDADVGSGASDDDNREWLRNRSKR